MTTYKDAGVDINAAEETVDRIKSAVHDTYTDGVLADIGAFGGLFELNTDTYENPVLVSSIDGVGTKLKVAFRAERYDTIGQDLVNHCVNDVAVCGADPLFFLDYFSTGTLKPAVAEQVITGFATACKANGCALIGGEIAEMPDIYSPGEFDLAGTIVGAVDKASIVDGSRVSIGDVLIGLPSNGLHTNGFSLARKVLFDAFTVDDAPSELSGRTIGEELLRVHRSYLPIISELRVGEEIHAFAHVTGGGIVGNTGRVIPDDARLSVNWEAWERPAIFELIQQVGKVPEEDMRRTFNLGIGLVIAVAPEAAETITADLEAAGEAPVAIGTVVE